MTPGRSSVAALALLSLLTACRLERTERPALADPGSVARADIQTVLEEFAEALDARDSRRATTYFTPDAVLVTDAGPVRHGRAEIASGLERFLAGDSVTTIHLNSDHIDLAGAVAWQAGSFEQVTPDNGPAAGGRFVIRWQRGPEATWRMQHVMLARPVPDTVRAGS